MSAHLTSYHGISGRNHPDQHSRKGPARPHVVAHGHPGALRRLHSRHRPGQYPSVAYAGNPDQDDLRQIGCHHEGAALQIFGAGHQHPLHAHQRGALHGMGGYAGQEPLHHHAAGASAHGAPHRRRGGRDLAAGAQHRRDQAHDGPRSAARRRTGAQVMHRILGARIAHRRGHDGHSGAVHVLLEQRGGHLVPARRHLPPQPEADLFRHGFDTHRNRSDRRTGRTGGRRRASARHHRTRDAGRDRLPREFHRARGAARSWRRSRNSCPLPKDSNA